MSSPFLTTCQPWKLGFELENCITRPLSLSLCFRIVRAKCSAKNGERRRSGRRRGAGGKLCETVRRFPPRRRTLKNSGLLCEKERSIVPIPDKFRPSFIYRNSRYTGEKFAICKPISKPDKQLLDDLPSNFRV